jgi:hypothetical protein
MFLCIYGYESIDVYILYMYLCMPDVYNTLTLKTELILSNDKETVIGRIYISQRFWVFMNL